MFLTRSKKSIAAACTIVALLLSSVFFSCQKEISGIAGTLNPGTPPDLTTKIASSVSGFVTDENNAPVNGATVQVGSTNTTTDQFGYFSVSNAQVVKNAALVTVTKSGYFKGIKTYTAQAGKSAFFRVQLIPKTIVGNVDVAAGGTVSVVNGISVKLPANGVVKADGSAYTGQVNVAAYWIDPTAVNLSRIMPGDLRALDKDGILKTLTTFGMAAVELTGAAGEALQIKTGSKATLTYPIPSALMAKAPATLPLWYMDEATGLWKEQGTATKTGNTYVGDVSHFSFWNCDVPNDYVPLSLTVVNTTGTAVPNTWVRIYEVSNPYNARWGWTDSSGYVSGLVPANTQLQVEVLSDWSCGTPAASQTVTTASTAVNLGNITIATASQAVLNGSVTNCTGGPVTNGYVIVQNGYNYYRLPLTANGTYTVSTSICVGVNAIVTIIGVDETALQQSDPITYTLNPGNNNVPGLSACGTTVSEFFNYTLNGATYTYSLPADSLYQYLDQQSTSVPSYVISANSFTGGTNNFATLGFAQAGIAVGSAQDITLVFLSTIGNDSLSANPPVKVNITEFGSPGQFMAGNFSGVMTGRPPTSTTYNLSGSFRVRRNF